MSERETLLNWLDRAAARARYGSWLRDSAALACALLVLAALHQALRATIPAPEVFAALVPFFVFTVVGAVALFTLRLWRQPTREQAAKAADARAGLHDELRSALWFTQPGDQGPLVEQLVAHASRTVATLDARRLFPLVVPRGLVAGLSLALLAVAVAWFLPGAGLHADVPGSDPIGLSRSRAGERTAGARDPARRGAGGTPVNRVRPHTSSLVADPGAGIGPDRRRG